MRFSRNEATAQHVKSFFFTTVLIVALFCVLLMKLLYIQLWKGQTYRNLSENNRIRLLEQHAPRGKIMDTNHVDLADNRPSFHVTVIPEEVKDFDALESILVEVSPLPRETLKERFEEMKKAVPFRAFTLWTDADWETMAYLEANRLRIPGVVIQVNQTRDYLYGELLAHVLGYMGEINAEELKQDLGQHYRMGDWVGKSGVELIMEKRLRGKKGGVQVEVDAMNREIGTIWERASTPGANVVLHIDIALQQAAWDAMKGQTGTVLAADPRNGNILCYVNAPAYDPNLFIKGLPVEAWQTLQKDKHRPLTNRAIQGQYPPGSVFKIVMAVAALEEDQVSPGESLYCGGNLRMGSWNFRCWKRRGHGPTDLHKALVESCDVYFYQLGQRLGIRGISEYAQQFGFGSRTGIRIAGEQSGLVPSPEWKKKRYGEPWYDGETLTVSIGQGALLVTPLQVLMMTCAVANGGRLWAPTLIKQLEYPDGKIYWKNQPQRGTAVPMSEKTGKIVRRALRDVVQGRTGTGRRARLEYAEIDVAGKTGTAQVVRQVEMGTPDDQVPWEQRDHAWFTCYAPAENPEIAVVVLVEHGGHGGAVAAPVAQKVLQAYFEAKDPEIRRRRQEVEEQAGTREQAANATAFESD